MKHLGKEAVIKRLLSATAESARGLLTAVLAGEATIAVSLVLLLYVIELEVGDRFWLTATAHSWLAAEDAEQLSQRGASRNVPISASRAPAVKPAPSPSQRVRNRPPRQTRPPSNPHRRPGGSREASH